MVWEWDRARTADQLALFVDCVEDYALFLLDTEGRVATWNEGARRIKGYEGSEIIGQRFTRFYTPEDRADHRPEHHLVTAAREGRVEDEGWRVRKDGSRFWANVVITALRDPEGRLWGYGKVTRDLTERRAHEERATALAVEAAARDALARSERWLVTTLRSIGDAVIATDDAGQVVFMNPVAEDLTGWRQEEARGHRLPEVFRIVNEHTRETVESPVDKVLRDGLVVGLANHTILVARDGGERAIDDSGAPIKDADGVVAGVVMVFRDITGRRQVEAELARSMEELSAARSEAERANHRLEFLVDAGQTLSSSLAVEEILRSLAAMAVPRLADWCSVEMTDEPDGPARTLVVAHVNPEKVALAEELRRKYPPDPDNPRGIDAVIRTGRSELYPEIADDVLVRGAVDEQHLALLRDLALRSAMIVPICGREQVHGALTLVSAETKRQYTPRDLSLAEELGVRAGLSVDRARLFRRSQELNRLKDDFLATLSHELRTPLSAILGWAQLSRRGKVREDTPGQAMAAIDRNSRRLVHLVDELLDVSRIVTGKLEVDLQPMDVVDVVEAAVEDVRPQVDAKGLELAYEPCQQYVPILGDSVRLQQVIGNLLSNAVKFTPAGGRITVAVGRSDGQATITVQDTGIGVPEAFLPHLFERFRQADASTRREQGGLGIGLSIAQYLVDRHGGTIQATSPGEGLGSTFTVALPIRSADAQTEPGLRRITRSLRGVRILLVEDHDDTRELLTAVLTGYGAQVRGVASAPDALDSVDGWSPNLLVSDIALPGMDGYELMEALRTRGVHVPAIALTAYAAPEDIERALRAGFQAHVAKPVEPETLVEIAARTARPVGDA